MRQDFLILQGIGQMVEEIGRHIVIPERFIKAAIYIQARLGDIGGRIIPGILCLTHQEQILFTENLTLCSHQRLR